MDNFDLSAPVSVLFESDPVVEQEVDTKDFDIKLTKTRKLGNGYRGYYWKWFDHFKNFYFASDQQNLQLPSPNEFEMSFRIAHALYNEGRFTDVETAEDFFGVMESIINSNK
jgi:hypothetical protein